MTRKNQAIDRSFTGSIGDGRVERPGFPEELPVPPLPYPAFVAVTSPVVGCHEAGGAGGGAIND